jgi:ABC-type dipeptide/oligopeptide/nickel transport system permease subunit
MVTRSDAGPAAVQVDLGHGERLQRVAAWRRFRGQALPLVGVGWLVVIGLAAVWGPAIADPTLSVNVFHGLALPGWRWPEWLGTNNLGQSNVDLLLASVQPTVASAVLGAALGMVVALWVGVLAGLARGIVAEAAARAIDFAFAMPNFVIVVLLEVVLGASLPAQVLALGIVSWPGPARVIRGLALTLRDTELLESARMAGGTRLYMAWRYVGANILPTLWVFLAFQFGIVMGLSMFVAMTLPGSANLTPNLQELIANGVYDNLLVRQWVLWAPLGVFTLTVLAVIWVADGIERAVNPFRR